MKSHLGTVVNTARLLLSQVHSHMDSALREKGLLRSEPESCSIQSVVQLCVDMMKDSARYSNVDLIFYN